MQNRKFTADYLFGGNFFFKENTVLITNEEGKIIDVIDNADAGEDVEIFKGIISPGFVNAHCHLELSHLKNIIPEKTGLVDFVFKIVKQRDFAEEEIIDAIQKAECEMLQNGIVAAGDICNNSLTLGQKIRRSLSYYNFIEISGWLPQIAESRFSKSKFLYEEFLKNGLEASLVPHAPYSVSNNLWKKMISFFSGKTVTIHNQETADEDLFFMEGKGAFVKMYKMMNIDNSFYRAQKIRSLQSYFQRLSSAASVILVHNTFCRQEDIDFIKEHKNKNQLVSFCLCPNANLYIENTLPPVNLFLENDCNIILGTDSLASNHQLNILEEIKTIAKNFPEIKTETLLQWATSNGSKALQMDKQFGSFGKGKTPGLILIENTEEDKIKNNSTVKLLL